MLVRLRINVTVDDQQVLPAIVVVIEKAIAESDKGDGRLGNSSLVTDVCEEPGAIVLKKDRVIVGEGCAHHRKMPIILVVAGGKSHVGDFAAILIEREAALVALVFEDAVAFVDVEIVGR